jgi:hypothetical protein
VTGKPLPPFGKDYLASPTSAGLCVAIGRNAWDFAKRRRHRPVLVLPDAEKPSDRRWPSNRYGALLYETATPDDERLNSTAAALLIAGSPFVVAVRLGIRGVPIVCFYPAESSARAAV